MSSEANKEYSVNWKNHMSHVRKAFDNLLNSNELTDVTLSCEGRKIGAHKMLLSACSTYFRDTFKEVPCQHPVIVLYGVEYSVLLDILHFIYNGEVSVDTSRLDTFLKVAQLLQISGLTDDPNDHVIENENTQAVSEQTTKETYIQQVNSVPTSSDDVKRGQKRVRTKEIEVSGEKVPKQDSDTLFISDVKCEPSELVNFEDPLEDPLQQDQTNDTPELFGNAGGQNTGEQEFKIEIEENNSSERFGDETYPVKKIPYSTIQNRACIWSAFEKFCHERKYSLNESTSPEKMGEILADWGFNMRKTDGTDYKESVVKTIWNVTAKMLQEMFYEKFKIKFDPFRDIEFKIARDSRDIKRRQLKSEKNNIGAVRLNETERYQIYTMWDEETPSGLQRKFYHIAAFALSWKNREASNCLTRYFKKEINDSGIFTGRVEYNPRFGETMEESNPGQSKWLVVNTDDSNVCPVRLLFKLLEKRKSNSNIKTDRLFLTANPNWNRTETSAWYKDCPVSGNQIRAWIKEAAEMLGTDTTRIKITNRSKNPSTSKIL